MLKNLFLILFFVTLTACQTYHFSDEQPELSFMHLKPIPLKVHKVEIENHYKNTPNHKENHAYALMDSPRETLEGLIRSKIIPTIQTPSKSIIKFHIIEAKIIESEHQKNNMLEGILKIHTELLSQEQLMTEQKNFEIYVIKEAPKGLTLAQRDEVIFELNEALMQKFYDEFLKYKILNLPLL